MCQISHVSPQSLPPFLDIATLNMQNLSPMATPPPKHFDLSELGQLPLCGTWDTVTPN